MISKFGREFPDLLTWMPMILVGVSLRNKCISYCKRRLCVCWKGSGRVRERLCSLPARFSFETQQVGVTRIGTQLIETCRKAWRCGSETANSNSGLLFISGKNESGSVSVCGRAPARRSVGLEDKEKGGRENRP